MLHFTVSINILSLIYGSALVEQSGEKAGLGLLIFAAIICHKAPASFGFGTVLVQNELDAFSYAKHLGAFTLSSPLVNLLVYFGLLFT